MREHIKQNDKGMLTDLKIIALCQRLESAVALNHD